MAEGKTGKTLLEVEIDTELAAEAAAQGGDLLATLEDAPTRLKTADRGADWRRRNAPALEAYDRHIESDGFWSDVLRTWGHASIRLCLKIPARHPGLSLQS